MSYYTYQLWLDEQFCLYENSRLNYVFHEYLSYNTNYNLVIKKKLNDPHKKFALYLEMINYDKNNHRFVSNNNKIYSISDIDYLNNFTKTSQVQTLSTPHVNNPVISVKKYPVTPKVKIVDFDTNKESPKDETDDKIIEINDAKLKELEDLIENMENLKDEQLEKLKKEEEDLQNKDMQERRVKMEERLVLDKKKELKNIFEADQRLYLTFSNIIKKVQEFKDNEEKGIIDSRRPTELTKDELKAKLIFSSGKDFEIPIMFAHKYPIFKFMDEHNFLNTSHSFLVYKLIYYSNYELTTESRKFFGNKVYLLNEDELNILDSEITSDEKLLINNFTKELTNKKIDIEKLISKSIGDTQDFFKKPLKKSTEYEYQIETSESENSDSEYEENCT